MRRLTASICIIAFIIMAVGTQPIKVNAAADTVTIHYHRDDGDYEKWNLWMWPEGGEGKAFYFDEEDAFGRYMTVTLSKSADRIGFIVRTDSWEKDFPDDRFIETKLGTEIWISSGESEFSYNVPEEYKEEVRMEPFQLKLNYERYDMDYEDISIRLTYEDGSTTIITKDDITLAKGQLIAEKEVPYGKRIGLDILKGNVEDDYQGSSFSTSKIDENENLEVYLLQGTNTISPRSEFIGRTKAIESAFITSINEIRVKLTTPCKLDDIVHYGFYMEPDSLDAGATSDTIASVAEILIAAATTDQNSEYKVIKEGYADSFIITLHDDLDLSKKYAISKEGYGSRGLSVDSSIYSSEAFESAYAYTGNDLGATYKSDKTVFKVWAPTAESVSVLLYSKGEAIENEVPDGIVPMELTTQGVWQAEVLSDLKNVYYVYEVTVNGSTNLAVDPYAKAVGVNGNRGMVVDLTDTDPEGFREHSSPAFESPVDAVIYEIHVRDLSMNENSGINNKGKFLGFTETGTTNSSGLSTGIDHMKELGVTHVHLLPSFDYKTIDETKLDENKFNWGYDPQNYNAPEGSYSTDPYNGEVRVKEFKEMVQALHENGLRVVMDVVYNHTFTAGDSSFSLIVPGYYYRMDSNGKYTNGSGCGNETASERAMMRKFIVDSVVYWATEYKVDGFRFDLMALHDIETMNDVRKALNEIDPSIIIYGEGWTGATSPLPESQQALKNNAIYLDTGIACFSDDIRDAIKGSVFNTAETGFVNNGKRNITNRDESIKFGIAASVSHPQINIDGVSYSSRFWALEPTQTVNYASAHDNLTLWDKLSETNKAATEEELIQMNKLSAAIVLTSQGIPFFHAGEEMARTKKGNDNSYQAPDSINMINWDNKTTYNDLYNYYKGLIELRKAYPAFRMQTAAEINEKIEFVDTEFSVIAYRIHDALEDGREIAVIFNGTLEEKQVTLDANAWDVLVNKDTAGTAVIETIKGGTILIPSKSTLVLLENKTAVVEDDEADKKEDMETVTPTSIPEDKQDVEDSNKNSNKGLFIGLGIAAIIVLAGGLIIWRTKRKR